MNSLVTGSDEWDELEGATSTNERVYKSTPNFSLITSKWGLILGQEGDTNVRKKFVCLRIKKCGCSVDTALKRFRNTQGVFLTG
jgi:hypothetical protein